MNQRLKYTRCFSRTKKKGKRLKLDKRDRRPLFMRVPPTVYKRPPYSDSNRSHNTSLCEHIAEFPHHPLSLGTRNSSSLARTFLIYTIFNSSIHFSGVSPFRCLRNLWMEHEEIFWKDSFITKALTTQPKNKVDFIVRLQIEESNGT